MTPAPTPTPILSDREFADLRAIIHDRAGLFFPDNKRYILESRLSPRLAELDLETFGQYVQFLSVGPDQQNEFQELFNRVTINETSFFRNELQLNVFEKRILPELLEARRECRVLRIWSAACSTGDEPYTLAIIIHRTLGTRLADWKIEILGTDISERALATAEAARYSDYAVRATPAHVKSRFFAHDAGAWKLSDTIRSMVDFETHNLKEVRAARRFGIWDVIFFRNVAIYFDEEMKQSVFRLFADQLAPDGRLFIGHSENVRSPDFESLPIPQGFVYRKTAAPFTAPS